MKDRIQAALGENPADLVFKNALVVDVFCRTIRECDVAVHDGFIVGLGNYRGKTEIDARGKYLMPSFIDSHVHIESSLLCPSEYARLVCAQGVTALIADPHEITNVCGEEGLSYMLEDASGLPIDIFYMLPSCVPATPYEPSGASLDAKETGKLLRSGMFFGLGEMMDVPGVLSCKEETLGKIACAARVDGHAPGCKGKELAAYCVSGIQTDHECSNTEEMQERISMGMYVEMREGSQAKNVRELCKGVTPATRDRVLFCTDDRHLSDVYREGSIKNCVKVAILSGVDPIDAIRMASYNAAQCYGLSKRGAVAPGFRADLILSDDLASEHILFVYKDGTKIAENGVSLFSRSQKTPRGKTEHSVMHRTLRKEDFTLNFTGGMPAMQVNPDSLDTDLIYPDSPDALSVCAVIERHGKSGKIGLCYAKGFSLQSGAIAQSIGHDSHHITVLGNKAEDMLAAVDALGTEGGLSVVKDGKVLEKMYLPVGGIFSDENFETVLAQHDKIEMAALELGYNQKLDPFVLLSFLSLPVIPHVKLLTGGLFDVDRKLFL